MEKRKMDIAREVEKTMDLMENAEKLKASDDFFKKVNFRLHDQLEAERTRSGKIIAALKPAALVTITLLNLFSAYLVLSSTDFDESRYEDLNTLTEEMNLSSSDTDWFSFLEAGE